MTQFVRPKMTWDKCEDDKYHHVCHRENPCTTFKSGRMIYIYSEKNLRAYPGTIRNTDERNSTYKTRTYAERALQHFKDSFYLAERKTQNVKNSSCRLDSCRNYPINFHTYC